MSDEHEQRVGFFRGLWAVGRGILRVLGTVLSGARRLLAFGARRARESSDDAPVPT